MKLSINGKEFVLDPDHVAKARDAVNTLLITAKNAATQTNNQALYWTVVLMMYKKSTYLLDGVGLGNLEDIFKVYNQDGNN